VARISATEAAVMGVSVVEAAELLTLFLDFLESETVTVVAKHLIKDSQLLTMTAMQDLVVTAEPIPEVVAATADQHTAVADLV
jgi:hypothetical protein